MVFFFYFVFVLLLLYGSKNLYYLKEKKCKIFVLDTFLLTVPKIPDTFKKEGFIFAYNWKI